MLIPVNKRLGIEMGVSNTPKENAKGILPKDPLIFSNESSI